MPIEWTEDLENLLRKIYPTWSREDILNALEDVGIECSWHAVEVEANKLGLVRIGWGEVQKYHKSPFDSMGYCSKCEEWLPLEKIPDNLRCPIIVNEITGEKCNNKMRVPSPRSWRRRKKND